MRPSSVVVLGVINHTLEYDMSFRTIVLALFAAIIVAAVITVVCVVMSIITNSLSMQIGVILLTCIGLAALVCIAISEMEA
jgi:hypothetical protein